MQVEKAKETGFCFGVKRALKLLEKAIEEYGDVETLGFVVHNRQVIDNLSKFGVKVIESLDQVRGNVVIIPSHGVSPRIIEELQTRSLRIVDATCPIVKKAHMAAKGLSKGGFSIIVFGDPEHPEVKGLLGWAGAGGLATLDTGVVSKLEELPHRLGFLSQTTQNPAHFAHFVNNFIALSLPQIRELRIINTICDVTKRRQTAAFELAKRVNLMIIVGGESSANTRRLTEICSSTGVETHQIETAAEIQPSWLREKSRVGVTSGTSTPDQIIEEVILRLKELSEDSV